MIIEALQKLDERGVNYVTDIYGDPTDRDHGYYEKIRTLAAPLEKKGKIVFHQAVPNRDTPAIYSAHDIFINATPQGSFDKTVLEAAACGVIPVVCNESFADIFSKELFFKEGDARDLAMTLGLITTFSQKQREEIGKKLHERVAEKHGLHQLIAMIADVLT
jgi:glycosyltransferase involved in cell wall biosynthesis